MTRLLAPIILIGISITGFLMFTNPLYTEISTLKNEMASYDEALTNSKALESERDKLTQKYNSIGAENIAKLAKLLPESVDNIRLILEIEKIAAPYGMTLRDVRYDDQSQESPENDVNTGVSRSGVNASNRGNLNYGSWNLEFSISGTYKNFVNFLKDLESNLRIVDVVSINFSSSTGNISGSSTDVYKYDFKIKTYWLKN